MELSQKYLDLVNAAKKKISAIDSCEVIKMIEENVLFILIDIREESEWKNDRIPKAIYIGKGILEREIESIVPNEKNQDCFILWRWLQISSFCRELTENGLQ